MNFLVLALLSAAAPAPLPLKIDGKVGSYCIWEPNKGVTAVVSGPAVLVQSEAGSGPMVIFNCAENVPHAYAEMAFKLLKEEP